MIMPIARVDPSVMRFRADQLREEARNMGALMVNLKRLSESVQIEWQCEESKAFGEWFTSTMRPSLTSEQETINAFASALEKDAEKIEL